MDEAASSEKRRYGLFVRRSGGIALKHGDEGVGLHDGLLFWSSQKGEVARPLSDVTGVHLSVAHIARHGDFGVCTIALSGAQPLVVSGSSAYGFPEEERNETYRFFIGDLHASLAGVRPPGMVRYSSGASEARLRFVQALLVVMGLMMFVLPLTLLLLTGELSMIGATAVGGAFTWGYYGWTKKNAPRTYEPARIPPELLP